MPMAAVRSLTDAAFVNRRAQKNLHRASAGPRFDRRWRGTTLVSDMTLFSVLIDT